jgi:hypothetical protein
MIESVEQDRENKFKVPVAVAATQSPHNVFEGGVKTLAPDTVIPEGVSRVCSESITWFDKPEFQASETKELTLLPLVHAVTFFKRIEEAHGRNNEFVV